VEPTSIDLNKLRERLLRNQQANNPTPSDPTQQVWVDSEGQIMDGNQATQNERPVSQVPQRVFASRLEQDRQAVKRFLPANTREKKLKSGQIGFVFTITCQFGQAYELFLYFDGNNYQVLVLRPAIEERIRNPHVGHLFTNGQLCLGEGYGNGAPNVQEAYSRSVLWANGITPVILGEAREHVLSSNNSANWQ
jgi:hypothetical protein